VFIEAEILPSDVSLGMADIMTTPIATKDNIIIVQIISFFTLDMIARLKNRNILTP
jgi:hypothetical protein